MEPSEDYMSKALKLSDLHLATILGRTREVLALLAREDKKELIEARDADGSTPLMTAVLTGRLAIAKLLLRHSASVKTRDYHGYRVLDYTRESLFKNKLGKYRRLGLPPMSQKQRRERLAIAKILRHRAALRSRFVRLLRFRCFYLPSKHTHTQTHTHTCIYVCC